MPVVRAIVSELENLSVTNAYLHHLLQTKGRCSL